MKNYGLVISKEKDPNAFILGGLTSLTKTILQPTSQWDAFLPDREVQNTLFETYNCTGYGTNAILETLLKRLGSTMGDRSDRYLAIRAGTKPPGNDPHKVAQAARDYGVIAESSLPFKNLANVNEYYSFKNGDSIADDLEGQDFLNKFDVGHEYVWDGKISKEERMKRIKECLQYSPLGVSVSAWTEKDGVYVDAGKSNNHWTMAYGYTETGIKIFDSYDNNLKLLSWEHNIAVCKRYALTPSTRKEQLSIFQKILQVLQQWLNLTKSTPNLPPITPSLPPIAPKPEPEQPKYHWDTPILARHSLRLICDEMSQSVSDKNIFCATMGAESHWNPKAVGEPNKDGTRDYGICQINTRYWIGEGKPFPSTDYVLTHPEECIRWAYKQWLAGHRSYWAAYNNGSFTKYL